MTVKSTLLEYWTIIKIKNRPEVACHLLVNENIQQFVLKVSSTTMETNYKNQRAIDVRVQSLVFAYSTQVQNIIGMPISILMLVKKPACTNNGLAAE